MYYYYFLIYLEKKKFFFFFNYTIFDEQKLKALIYALDPGIGNDLVTKLITVSLPSILISSC